MARRWHQFLREPASCSHGVQVYADVGELSASVAAYLSEGFAAGDPAVVIATPPHWRRFAAALADAGHDVDRLEREGRLVVADAESTLRSFMAGATPSPAAFARVVGGIVDDLEARFPGRRLRAFGEMVDVLSRHGETEAAIALEGLWNDLARDRSFSLLCGYRLDIFDPQAQRAVLPHVCGLHSHVMPAADTTRLARAVDRALEEVLGRDQAGKVYVVVGRAIRETRIPAAQLALMWVSDNMPGLADRVLSRARQHYAAGAPA